MESQAPKSRIEKLQKILDARDQRAISNRKDSSFDFDPSLAKDWQHEGGTPDDFDSTPVKTNVFRNLLIFSIGFFMIAAGFGAYMLYGGSNVISVNNVAISVLGPVAAPAGAPVPLDITVENKNDVALQLADLIIDYPDGTKSSVDLTAALLHDRETLGDIAPGQIVQRHITPVLFGPENTQKDIAFEVQYRVKDSNAIFSQKAAYSVNLSSSPISMTVNSVSEVNSGQGVDLTVDIVSNSSATLKSVLLQAAYPFGFTFSSAEPTPQNGGQVWRLGDLQPQGKRTIKIHGILQGEDQEQRVFKFNVGIASAKDENVIGTSFISSADTIAIQKPFIGVQLALDGDDADNHVARLGGPIRGLVTWTNNLPTQVYDGQIQLKINGNLVDPSSITVDQGFYRSSDNTIVWDKTTDSALQTVNPGDTGNLSFSFNTLRPDPANAPQNPQVAILIDASGRRVEDANAPQQVVGELARTVKFGTNLNLISNIAYRSGPFSNAGPLPPKADAQTSYTVTWTVNNSSNVVSHAVVSAPLPSYVKWLNVISNPSEHVTFSSVNNQITWDLGTVQPAGTANARREVSFQVSYLASLSQVGTVPNIIGLTTLVGHDQFTNTDLSSSVNALTTKLTSDPSFTDNQAVVTK